ncbi:ABC transporter permease [Roseburia hominis]|uniref:ABC transporter permease n=1 Tax=Roseburia hominis TaxID=301301 RepID=UPI001F174220|nr:ABC transporter permease [Roseburia hominis]
MKRDLIRKTILALIIPAIVVLVWFYATTYTSIPSGILPSISDVGKTFVEIFQSGQLKEDILVSMSRVLKGYLLSAALGIILGSLIGMYQVVKEIFVPIITVIRQIPMIAWIPLIVLWCGIGESSKVVIIVLVAFFQILVNTQSGIESTPKEYIEVAKLYKLSRWKTFTKVYLPHAVPQMLVGLRLGLGGSWMAVVAAELIAATSGIGYRMSSARSNMQSDVVIVYMIVVGIIGVLMDKGIGVIFEALTPWRKVENKHGKER